MRKAPKRTLIKLYIFLIYIYIISFSDCASKMGNSLILMGDIEGNDIGYSLTQGKSIAQVRTYLPHVIRAQIKVTKVIHFT